MSAYKILIVEDEMIAALSLQDTLQNAGFKVTDMATSGPEALASVVQQRPDLVLMDINLQEKDDGIVIGKQIMQEYRIPVVFITAYSDKATISRAREIFPYGYMVKPWQEGELIAVLETAIYKFLADKRALELNDTRNKFYSIIGHDLRSPLAALSVTTRAMLKHIDGLSKEELVEMLQDVHSTVENLYAFTDNMLEWSRIQSGRLEVLPEVFLLKPLAEEVVTLLQGKALNKSIKVSLGIDNSLTVFADKNMVRSILVNLLSNGLKFSNTGGMVHISSRVMEKEVLLEVMDQGVGMSAEQARASLNFKQVMHTPGTQEEKGTGLGLLLCKEFAEANGGRLLIRSNSNKGTTVTVMLPRWSQ